MLIYCRRKVRTIDTNKRIKQLRTQLLKDSQGNKYSCKDFANKLGFSRDAIANIEYNRVVAKDNTIKLICLTFNVNEEWLRNGIEPIFNEDNNTNLIDMVAKHYTLSPISKSIVEKYLKLDENKQKDFENFIFSIAQDIDTSSKNNIVSKDDNLIDELLCIDSVVSIDEHINIKIYGIPMSAGVCSSLIDDVPNETLTVNPSITPQARRADFALYVKGDSMEDTYYHGDIVYIKEQPYIDNNQIGIFIYDNESYIKKYFKDDNGQIFLLSLNKKYKPIKIKKDTLFKVCGIVL